MIESALRKLRLDRRLLNRRGWISREELERALAELPDVSDKIAPAEESSAEPAADGRGTDTSDASDTAH
jgi:hypothetical protein